MSSTLVAGDYGPGLGQGFVVGGVGSLTPGTFSLVSNTLCANILTGLVPGVVYCQFFGDVTAHLTGSSLRIDGVDHSINASYPPTYDGGAGQTSVGYTRASNFTVSSSYTVDLVNGNPYAGPTWVGTTPGVGSNNTFNITFASTGRASGDQLYIAVMTANQPLSAPTGFTQEGATQSRGTAGVGGGVALQLFTKVSDGTEGTVAIPDGGDIQYAVGFVIRGAGGAAVAVDVSTGNNVAATTSISADGVTTSVDDTLVLNIIATDRDSAGPTFSSEGNPSLLALTERFDAGTSTGTGGGIALYSGERKVAGTISATTATGAASAAYCFITLALKNSSGGPTVSSGAGAISMGATAAGAGQATKGGAGAITGGASIAATGRIFAQTSSALTAGGSIAGSGAGITLTSATIAGGGAVAAEGRGIGVSVGTVAAGASIAGALTDSGSGGACVDAVLHAGASGTQRGYSDVGFGSLTPAILAFGGIPQRVTSDTSIADKVAVRFSDNTGGLVSTLAATSLRIDSVVYPIEGTPTWDDGDLWTQATYTTTGFSFSTGVDYCVQLIVQGADTGAGTITSAVLISAHGQVISAGAGALSFGASVAGTGSSQSQGAGVLSAAATVTAAGYGLSAGAGAIAAGVTAAATGGSIRAGAASIALGTVVAAGGGGITTGSATLSAGASISGSSGTISAAAGTVSVSVQIQAPVGSLANGAGAISAALGVAAPGVYAVRVPPNADRTLTLTDTGSRGLVLSTPGSRHLEL